MPLSGFPALNASLNAAAGVLLVLGWWFIKRREIARHKACMLAAFATSTTFLACYLYYHFHAGSRSYAGPYRPLYLAILLTHTVLAVAMLPFIWWTLLTALTGNFNRHVWWARRALPVWIYVSFTGVVVYWMLYRL